MTTTLDTVDIPEAPPARFLFNAKMAAPIWLVARLWLGYEWIHAAWEKIWGAGNNGWMHGGIALRGFATGAIKASQAPKNPQVAYGWYADFLHFVRDNASWLAKVIAVGELLIGVAILVGFLTGIAAFFGVVLNFNFVFAGAAGVNPAFMLVGLGLILAWRVAGYLGADYFVLPALGTPWSGGQLLHGGHGSRPVAAAA